MSALSVEEQSEARKLYGQHVADSIVELNVDTAERAVVLAFVLLEMAFNVALSSLGAVAGRSECEAGQEWASETLVPLMESAKRTAGAL